MTLREEIEKVTGKYISFPPCAFCQEKGLSPDNGCGCWDIQERAQEEIETLFMEHASTVADKAVKEFIIDSQLPYFVGYAQSVEFHKEGLSQDWKDKLESLSREMQTHYEKYTGVKTQ